MDIFGADESYSMISRFEGVSAAAHSHSPELKLCVIFEHRSIRFLLQYLIPSRKLIHLSKTVELNVLGSGVVRYFYFYFFYFYYFYFYFVIFNFFLTGHSVS